MAKALSTQIRYAKGALRKTLGVAAAGIVAAVFLSAALVMLTVALFLWLASRSDPLTAALVLGAAFGVLAGIAAIVALLLKNSPVRIGREPPAQAATAWLEPSVFAAGVQAAHAVGGRKATSVIAAALAAYWVVRGRYTRK
ncbi:MAG: hypothetical protein JO245_04030 [Pseudolabrys sp.]|nr:hypothetical protein [Pseudolabrys sp.]